MNGQSDLIDAAIQQRLDEASAPGSTMSMGPNLIQQAINQGREEQQNQFAFGMLKATQTPPQEYKQVVDLSRLTGVPTEAVKARRTEIEREQKRNQYIQVFQNYQRTAAALNDEGRAALMQDDLSTLQRLEDLLGSAEYDQQSTSQKLGNAFKKGLLGARQSFNNNTLIRQAELSQHYDRIDELTASGDRSRALDYLNEIEAPPASAADLFRYLGANEEDRGDIRSMLLESVDAVQDIDQRMQEIPADARLSRAMEEGATELFGYVLSNPIAAADITFQGLGTSAPSLAVGLVGGPLLGAISGFPVNRGAKVLEAIQERGVDVQDTQQLLTALANPDVVNDISKRSTQYAAAFLPADLLSFYMAGKVLAPASAGGRPLSDAAREGINLAVQAPLQGVLEASGELSGQLAYGGEISTGEIAAEFIGGMGSSGVDIAVFGNRRIRGYYRAGIEAGQKAERDKRLLDGVAEIAEDLQGRQIDPQAAADTLDIMLQGTPAETLYIPTSKIDQLAQSANMDPAQFVQENFPALAERYAEARAFGLDMEVAGADYFANVPKQWHDQIADGIHTTPGGMSQADYGQWSVEAGARLDAMVDELRYGVVQDMHQVRDDMVGQLIATGYGRNESQLMADTLSQSFSVFASRINAANPESPITAMDLYRRFELQFTREAPAAVRAIPVADLDLMLERLRSGDIPNSADLFGTSLVDGLIAAGGVIDDGGELSAMDADVGRIGRNRLTRTGGMTLDDAATWAQERGYFDGLEDVTPHTLTEAIREELAGTPRYSAEQENTVLRDQAQSLQELSDYLEQSGISLDQLTNEQVRDALLGTQIQGGQQLAQSGPSQRGQISFADRNRFEILITPDSDLSTVFHEMGHYYLEVLDELAKADNAPPEFLRDMQTIKEWWAENTEHILQVLNEDIDRAKGAEKTSLEAMRQTIIDNGGGDLLQRAGELFGEAKSEAERAATVLLHEYWARGFESYIRTGQAPNIELQGAFDRFKRWLTEIYRSLSSLRVNLNDEVRQVMDRMLATDDAIVQAEEMLGLSQQYESSILALMSEQEQEQYQIARERAENSARNEVEQELIKAERRKLTKEYRDERNRVEAEVRASLSEQQVYRAKAALYGRNDFEDIGKPLRLSASDVRQQFGANNRVVRMLRPATRKEGGMPTDLAADLLGYSSAVEMVKDLMASPSLDSAVRAETQRQMDAAYPDPRMDGSLADMAIHAVTGEQRGKVLELELRVLGRGRTVGSREMIRRAAERIIASKRVIDLQPGQFQRAEAKAAALALEAAAAGDLQQAYAEKEKQLMNMYLHRESMAARDRAEKQYSKARQYIRKGAKRDRLTKASVENFVVQMPDGQEQVFATRAAAEQAAGDVGRVMPQLDYLQQVDALLDEYEFRKVPLNELRRRETLREFIARAEEGDIFVNMPFGMLEGRIEAKNYRELTLNELDDVISALQMIDKMAEQKLGVLVDGKWEELQPRIDAVVEAIRENGSKASASEFATTFGERLRRYGRELLSYMAMDSIAREVDGAETGPVAEFITLPVQQANRRLVARLKREHGELADLLNQFYTPEEQRRMNATRIAVPELNDSMTKMQMIMLMANLGNQGNIDALMNQVDNPWTPSTIAAVMRNLDPKDADFVETLWGWIDKFFPEIAEQERARTGGIVRKVEGKRFAVTLSDGQARLLKGGYFPLKYSAEKDARAAKEQDENAFKNMRAGKTAKAYTPEGHRESRVGSGGRVVDIGVHVLTGHVDSVVRDLEMTNPVNNAWRLLRDPIVSRAFKRNGISEFQTALELAIQDAAAGEQVNTDPLSKFSRWSRSNFTGAVMLFNFANSALNLTSAHPVVTMGKRWATRGYRNAFSRSKWNQMYELSEFMREIRAETFNKELTLILERMEGSRYSVAKRWIFDIGYYSMVKTQIWIDGVVWMGSYEKAQSQGMTETEAALYADQRVIETNSSGVFADRSALERGTFSQNTRQNEAIRAMTILGGYMLRKWQIARGRTLATDFKDIKQVMDWTIDMTLLFTIEGLIYSAMKGTLDWGDDEDDEIPVGTIAADLMFESVKSGSNVPVLREVVGELEGFGSGTTSYSLFAQSLGHAVSQAKQGEADGPALRSMVFLAGMTTGFPAAATNRVISAAERDMEGEDVPWWEYFTGNRNR